MRLFFIDDDQLYMFCVYDSRFWTLDSIVFHYAINIFGRIKYLQWVNANVYQKTSYIIIMYRTRNSQNDEWNDWIFAISTIPKRVFFSAKTGQMVRNDLNIMLFWQYHLFWIQLRDLSNSVHPINEVEMYDGSWQCYCFIKLLSYSYRYAVVVILRSCFSATTFHQ